MIKKIICLTLIVFVLFPGCYSISHTVGDGHKGSNIETARQWYVLWGLVPLNKVDSKDMAKGATDYTIKTEITALDFLISIVTGWVTIYPMTVEVKK